MGRFCWSRLQNAPQQGGSKMDREFADGTFTRSEGESPNHGNGLFFRLGATYHLTDKDDFYATGFGMFGHNWGRSSTLYTSNVPDNWMRNFDISRNRGDHRGMHAELGYIHKWSDNHSLDINAAYNRWGGQTGVLIPRKSRIPTMRKTYTRSRTWICRPTPGKQR